MILFKGKKFKDYVDFQYFLIKEEMIIHEGYFEHANILYIRSLLNEKFKTKYTVKQTRQLINKELALKTITLYDGASQSNVSC